MGHLIRLNPSSLKEAVNLLKMVKPSSKDYMVRINGSNLEFTSKDARTRSFAIAEGSLMDGDPSYVSDDFYLSMDRVQILDYNGTTITVNENSNGLNFRIDTDGVIRQASVRKRNSNALRKPEFTFKTPEFDNEISASLLEQMFHYVSCSAQVGETKTEQDMKVNQVHFMSEASCLMANARTHASFVFTDATIPKDLSIVSSDVPAIRSFLSRCDQSRVGFDKLKFNLSTDKLDRWISFSRVRAKVPPLSIMSEDGYSKTLVCESEPLLQALNWAKTSVEGTSKIELKMISSVSKVEIHGPTGHVSEFFFSDSQGDWSSPVNIHLDRFLSMVRHSTGRYLTLKYSHSSLPHLFEITSSSEELKIRHFMQAMRN